MVGGGYFFRVRRIRRRVTMKGLRFRNPFLFLVVVFLIFVSLMFSGAKSKAEQLIGDWWVGVYLNATNNTYTQNTALSISNDTYTVAGIFVENDTRKLLNDLTINATLSAEFSNSSASISLSQAYGIYFNGTASGSARPLGNLTITSNGVINATSTGRNARAYGVYAGSIGNFTMKGGTISATAATDGYAEAAGVYVGSSIGNFMMQNGTISAIANARGFYAWASGVYARSSIGNFTMTNGTISATANATGGNATAAGVWARSSIDNFTMTNGTISANATGGDARAYGVYAWFFYR